MKRILFLPRLRIQRWLLIGLQSGFLVLTLTIWMTPQSAKGWSIAQQIVNTPAHSLNPSSVIDSKGNTHVVWLENVAGRNPKTSFIHQAMAPYGAPPLICRKVTVDR